MRQSVIALPSQKSVFARRFYKDFCDDRKKKSQPFIFHTYMPFALKKLLIVVTTYFNMNAPFLRLKS